MTITARHRVTAAWWPLLELGCTGIAVLLWYLFPELGAWPLVIALAPWAAYLSLGGHLVRRTCFDLPLACFLLTAAVSVWAAYDQGAAWAKFWLIVGGVLLFYVLFNSGLRPATLAWLPTVGGACLALYFLLTNDWNAHEVKSQVLTSIGKAWQSLRPVIPASPLNPNEVGGILAMLVPFAAWINWHTWHKVVEDLSARRVVSWLLPITATGTLFLILMGLLMTVSRGAWLALGVIVIVAGTWPLAGHLAHPRPALRRGTWAALVIAGIVATLLAVVGLRQSQLLNGSLFSIDSLLGRLGFHWNSLLLVSDYPLIGAGLEGFEMLYSSYVLLIHVGFIPHSHSLFLSLAIDQGLPALLALLWMWGLVAIAAWQCATKIGNDPKRSLPPQLGVAMLSVLVILVHGFVDTALYGKFVFLLFLPLAFAALGLPPRREPGRRSLPRPWMVGLAVLALPILLWPGKSLSLFYANLGAVRQSQAELSIYSWPQWPLQDAVRRAVDLDPAVRTFERALALNPANPTANRRLGQIELSLGQYASALDHLEAAYAERPDNATVRQLYGEALLANGRLAEGQALWATVPDEQGQLAGRVYWYRSIGDEQRAAWMAEAAGRP